MAFSGGIGLLIAVSSVGLCQKSAFAQQTSVIFRTQPSAGQTEPTTAVLSAKAVAPADAPDPSEVFSSANSPDNSSARVSVTGVVQNGRINSLPEKRITIVATDGESQKPALPVVGTNGQRQAAVVHAEPAGQSPATVVSSSEKPVQPQASFFNVVSQSPAKAIDKNVASNNVMSQKTGASGQAVRIPMAAQQQVSDRPASSFNFFNVTSNSNGSKTPAAGQYRPNQTARVPMVAQQQVSDQPVSSFNFFNVTSNLPANPSGKNFNSNESRMPAAGQYRPNQTARNPMAAQQQDSVQPVSSYNFFNVMSNPPTHASGRNVYSSTTGTPAVRPNPSYQAARIPAVAQQQISDQPESHFNLFNVVTKSPSYNATNSLPSYQREASRPYQSDSWGMANRNHAPTAQAYSSSMQGQDDNASQFNFFNVVTRTPDGRSGDRTANMQGRDSNYSNVRYALQDQNDANGDGEKTNIADSETKLGSEPQSNELVFLRRQTVLLAPGQSQFDVGFVYSNLDNFRPLALVNGGGTVVGVANARVHSRLLVAPFAVRYGLTERIQLFADTAVGWSGGELETNGLAQTQDVGGIADSHAGMSMLLKTGECDGPDIVFTLGCTAPTGNDTFINSTLVPNAQLGQGFWSLFGNLLFVHTWDPVVVFYGVGYNHRFNHTFLGINVDPGEEFDYQLGVGFAVNSNVTLSGTFQGAYITQYLANGDLIEGSQLDPMRVRLAVTVAGNRKIWEPFAEIPMTDDAPARVGMTWTY